MNIIEPDGIKGDVPLVYLFLFIREEGGQFQEGVGNNLLPFVDKREQAATVEACTKAGGRVGRPSFPKVGRPSFPKVGRPSFP